MALLGVLLFLAPAYATNGPAGSIEPISLDVQQADILTILRTVSDLSGSNIVPGPEVQGLVTVRIIEVPWESALDVVLRAHGFGWKYDEAGIIRVTTIQNLQNEDLEREAAARKREDLLPLVTQIVTVNFANADEIEESIQTVLTKRGDVQTDMRTNSLIIKDIAPNLARAAELVVTLDQVTKQVEIVTKIVDVDAREANELGIEWLATGVNNGGDPPPTTADFGVSAPIATPIGQLTIGTTGPNGQLTANLQAMVNENKAEIIANPRITTLDNQEARIMVGKKIPLIVSDPSGNPITELTTIGIILRVVPHVHSDNKITLELYPEVSDLSSQATVQGGIIILTSQAQTRVMVESGHTAVIGGLVREIKSETEVGVPLLKDIPLFGYLFKSRSTLTEKRDLMIFVTPTVIDIGELSQVTTDESEASER